MRKFKRKDKPFEFQQFSRKQLQAMNWWRSGSPYADYDMIITDGAIRSGKTIADLCSFMQWTLETFSGEDFIIAGRTIGALKRNVIKPLKRILSAWGLPFEHNRSENYLTVGANTYHMFGASTEASQDVIQGLTAAGAFADEAPLFPRSFLEQMIGRCSVDGAKIFLNGNPLGPYHYFKVDYIDQAKAKRILRLHFTMDDNLSLSEATKARNKRMFTGIFYKRYILGLWVMAEGLIYDMFDESKHVVPTEPRRCEKHYVGVDYGTQNATTFGLWGLHKGVWYKVKEYYYSGRDRSRQKTDSEFADDMAAFVKGIQVTAIIVDPSAASFRAELKKRGFKVRNGDNAVVDGIRFVSTLLSEGKILYNDCCKETIKEFSAYSWDPKAADRGEDVPLKQFDHALDSDRYFLYTILSNHKTAHWTLDGRRR